MTNKDIDTANGFDLQDHERKVYFDGVHDETAEVTERIMPTAEQAAFDIPAAYRIDRPLPKTPTPKAVITVEQAGRMWNGRRTMYPHMPYEVDTTPGSERETFRVYLTPA